MTLHKLQQNSFQLVYSHKYDLYNKKLKSLYRGSCVLSMECKYPPLTRSSDDHGTTDFDRLLFFNMLKNSSRSLFRGNSGGSKHLIHRRQSGPDLGRLEKNNPWWNQSQCLMFSATQWKYLYHFITSLVWRGPWLGIEPGNARTRNQHSTTRLSRKRL